MRVHVLGAAPPDVFMEGSEPSRDKDTVLSPALAGAHWWIRPVKNPPNTDPGTFSYDNPLSALIVSQNFNY